MSEASPEPVELPPEPVELTPEQRAQQLAQQARDRDERNAVDAAVRLAQLWHAAMESYEDAPQRWWDLTESRRRTLVAAALCMMAEGVPTELAATIAQDLVTRVYVDQPVEPTQEPQTDEPPPAEGQQP